MKDAMRFQNDGADVIARLSAGSVVDAADANKCPFEDLKPLSEQGLPPFKLTLKEGCPVMLLRNLDGQKRALQWHQTAGEVHL